MQDCCNSSAYWLTAFLHENINLYLFHFLIFLSWTKVMGGERKHVYNINPPYKTRVQCHLPWGHRKAIDHGWNKHVPGELPLQSYMALVIDGAIQWENTLLILPQLDPMFYAMHIFTEYHKSNHILRFRTQYTGTHPTCSKQLSTGQTTLNSEILQPDSIC